VVCDGKDANLIADNRVDDTERKSSRDEATLALAPHGAKARILKQKTDGVLEFRDEGL